ncbi:MAG: VIT1/CCC1 transporter family protein [Lactobacillaceae bacterium]|jgi:VIT1/CCC1 family predicted Fe2+/Mn2+ transporter|nr:VIT1/CCC1 transporter family protein [Lactobacillaceae bacterium]
MSKFLKKFVSPIVYGGLDGIITTFAVVAGSVGGDVTILTIIILGFSNLLADGFSMAAGAYLSDTSDEDETRKKAFADGLATFVSFNVFGLIPLVAYLLTHAYFQNPTIAFPISFVIVGISLIILGTVKAQLSGQKMHVEVIRTLAVGYVAAIVAFGVGFLLNYVL